MTTGDAPDRAAHLVDLGRADQAVELLSQHLAAQPDDWFALCQLARAHLARDDAASAGFASQAAIRAAPDREWGHRLAAIAAMRREDHARAIAHAQEAVRLEPDTWQTRHTLSRAFLAAQRIWPAHEEARWAVHLAPLEAQAHLQLSIAAEARRYHEEADAALRQALQLDPLYPEALHYKASREMGRGRLGRAARTAMGAMRLDPDSEFGHENLSDLMNRLLIRLYIVTSLSGVVVGGLLVAGRQGALPAYWPRAVAGVLFAGVVVGVGWLTLRHVPPATRRHLAALPRTWRGVRLVAPAFFGVAAACLLAMAFLPSDVAMGGGVLLVVLIRIGQIMFIVWLVVSVVRGVSRWLSRKN
ncbi:MAG TPA: hypothetical protein VLI04_04045 [Nocardioidaceae bacterium]|nr:hypothetical protein [Nocardioidaceae bacterium]